MKIGCNGSIAHVLTNDKIENKGETLKKLGKESLKDTFALAAGTTGAIVAASNAGNIKNFAAKLKDTPIKEVATKGVEVAKKAVKNPKAAFGKAASAVKNNLAPEKLAKAAKALPAPAKAAIAAGVALFATYSVSKAGYIEGKAETK